MNRNFFKSALTGSILLAAVTVQAQDFTLGNLQVDQPWARDSAGRTQTGAIFLTIHNRADTSDKLLSARSEIAEKVELHTHRHEDGVMRMRQVEAIDVPAKGTTELAPGGHHLMLFDLEAPLQQDDSFPLTLTFEQAGNLKVEVVVEGVGTSAPDPEPQQHTHD
ncbi:copper chaperone PCu(A)C [Fodinicurvata halophila]|uniref:Copper chaperone PCu(A)C n=1 Tax=Fodinicurvata halophila TaxID=1419723 RepID=A0ABV8UK17_9PROT